MHHHHTLFDHFQETQEVGCDQDMTHAEVRKETELFHWFRLENKKGLLIYFTYEEKRVLLNPITNSVNPTPSIIHTPPFILHS